MADGDIDTGNLAGMIAQMSDTFSEGPGPSGDSAPAPLSPSDASANPASSAAPAPSPTAPAPTAWDTPPKAWKGDMHPHWSSLNPDVRKYLYEREDQAFKGISEARRQFDPYNQVHERMKPALEHYKVTPDQLPQMYERLMHSHFMLHGGPEEQRKALVSEMIRAYKLEPMLEALGYGKPAQQPQIDPMRLVQEAITPVRQQLETFQNSWKARELKEAQDMIDSFMADKKNEFAGELIEDITQLLKVGAADSLEDAYAKAMWQNPAVRQKLIAREVAAVADPKRPAPKTVQSSAANPSPSAAKGKTWEETLEATAADIASRS